MAGLMCRACRSPVTEGDLICPGCRANLTLGDALIDSDELAADEPTRLATHDESTEQPERQPSTPVDSAYASVDPAAHAHAPALACPRCGNDLPGADVPVCPTCLTPVVGALMLEFDGTTPHGGRWRRVLLPGAELVLGRDPRHSPAAPILDRYDTVSRRHARVAVDRDRNATVTDLGSLNGTFVDDTLVRPGTVVDLRPGSRLRLGRSVSFLVHRM